MIINAIVLFFSLFVRHAQANDVAGTLSKGGFPILSEKDKSYFVQSSVPLSKDSRFIIVRIKEDKSDFEVIANAKVQSLEKQGLWLVIADQDLKKLPMQGDFAVLMGEPKSFEKKNQLKPTLEYNLAQQDVEPLEPGYLQFGYTFFGGSYSSSSSTPANAFKNISQYSFQGFQIEWFVDFLPNYGITIKSFGGSVPVFSYYREEIPSSYSRLNLRFNYRTKRFSNNLRGTVFIDSLYEEFKTDNPDENVLSSKETSMGLGGMLSFEPKPSLLSFSGKSEFVFQRLFLSAIYYPKVQAQDSVISRGTDSNGSMRWDAGIGTTFLFNLAWVPWVKRYYLEAGYNVSETNLKFSGPTSSESGGVIIPQGGSGSEKDQYWYIQLGVRFDDVVGHALSPRN